MTIISNWKIDPGTEDLLAPVGKRVRNLVTVAGTDAATADYVNGQIGAAIFGGVQDGANLGAGVDVFSAKNGVNLEFNSLVPGNQIDISLAGGEITIAKIQSVAEFYRAIPPGSATTSGVWVELDSVTWPMVPPGQFWIDMVATFEHLGGGTAGLQFKLNTVVQLSVLNDAGNGQTIFQQSVMDALEVIWPGGPITVSVEAQQTGGSSTIIKAWTTRLRQKH